MAPWFILTPPENSFTLLNLCYLTHNSKLHGFSTSYDDAGYWICLPILVVKLPKAKTPHRGFITPGKGPWRDGDQPPPSSALKNKCSYTSTPTHTPPLLTQHNLTLQTHCSVCRTRNSAPSTVVAATSITHPDGPAQV
jgi:hypothetical protein